jgi:hypothetical protein
VKEIPSKLARASAVVTDPATVEDEKRAVESAESFRVAAEDADVEETCA